MACHPNPVFTPEQEARVREIVAQMIGRALQGADLRLREMTPEVLASRQRIIDAASKLCCSAVHTLAYDHSGCVTPSGNGCDLSGQVRA